VNTQILIVSGELQRMADGVRKLAREAAEMRCKPSHNLPLRDMSAWSALRAAQAWIAKREPPSMAWEGERVRRTALQIGYRRPVMEGRHRGLMRPLMTVDKISHEVAVFEEGIVERSIPSIAATLLHEATHIVTREVFCERYGFTPDEAFVVCDINDSEAWKTVFTSEGLAFWNEACWLFTGSPENIGEGGRDEMMVLAARMLARPEQGTCAFAEALASYADRRADFDSSGIDFPLVRLHGPQAGSLIDTADLAPSILQPLIEAVRSQL
jgi:hypothetical protein